jgi:L-glyceraldehyde 3-phosphate reductase
MYQARTGRYQQMTYARCGRSGIDLPRVALGLWHNFDGDRLSDRARRMLLRSFDHGINHFDLANNYGPPPGSAEKNFGWLLARDLKRYRDELIISTKAGWGMWDGPYGDWGSRKYLLASLDRSLSRLGLEYVDIFYSHRFDPATPLEETMGALESAVLAGKALYVGISSYSPEKTKEAADLLRASRTPFIIHQPSYSMFNRWIEQGLLDVLEQEGLGCIAFSPLSQGMLTDKYLDGIPKTSRAAKGTSFDQTLLTDVTLARVGALNEIAKRRGQTLAQMAVAWVLRDPRVTTALIGASRWSQIADALAALENTTFDQAELAEIDKYAVDSNVNLWSSSSEES